MNEQLYTDALNATNITYNGNENAMQNDMGNTKIQDSTTGNVMGLRAGFVPVGMVEHGGVMYIASVNKEGEGELGTIPSPIIKYDTEGKEYNFVSNKELTINNETGTSELLRLTDEQVRVGEKFIVVIENLGLEDQEVNSLDFQSLDGTSSQKWITETSYGLTTQEQEGLYSLKLYSETSDQIYDINDSVSDLTLSYPLIGKETVQTKTWFYTGNVDDIDLQQCIVQEYSGEASAFVKYPNIPAGYPAIKLEINKVDNFRLIPNYTSDESGERCYPFTTMDDRTGIYTLWVPGFVYESDAHIPITKIIYNIVDQNNTEIGNKTITIIFDDKENALNRIKQTDSYYIFSRANGSYMALYYDITDPDAPGLNNSSFLSTAISGFADSFNIGTDPNQWFTLNATYYYNDIILGTYECRFNPYVFDTLKNFKQGFLTPQVDYNGYGHDWFTQYYDVEHDTDGIIAGDLIDLDIHDYGGNRDYPKPSGLGINQYTLNDGYIKTYGTWDGWDKDKAFIITRKEKARFDLGIYDFIVNNTDNEKPVHIKRSGIFIKDLVDEETQELIDKNINLWPASKLEEYEYLYTSKPKQTISGDQDSFYYNFNNFGFRVNHNGAEGNKEETIGRFNITYRLLPDTNYTKSIPFVYDDNYKKIVILAPDSNTNPTGTIHDQNFELATKLIFNEQPIAELEIVQTEAFDSNDNSYYLDGDPLVSKYKYANDSEFEFKCSFQKELDKTYASDYEVYPQVNVVYEEDGEEFPGYLNNGSVEEIDVGIRKNYLLKNGVAEGQYLFTSTFDKPTNTTISGEGFGYFMSEINKYLSINNTLPAGTYVFNANAYNSKDTYQIAIGVVGNIVDSGTLNNCTAVFQTVGGQNCTVITFSRFPASFTLKGQTTLSWIYIKPTSTTYNSKYSFYSMGLYQVKSGISYTSTSTIKLQTVYRYTENGQSCLDKTYTYSGGAAQCGYQICAGKYDSSQSTFTPDDTNYSITTRQCRE